MADRYSPKVPLDWQDPTDEERVVLAVIRSKAKTQQDYKGPVFVNPGVCGPLETLYRGGMLIGTPYRDLVGVAYRGSSNKETSSRQSSVITT